MILKLAAVSAAAYGVYRLITQRNADREAERFQPAAAAGGTGLANVAVPAGEAGPYVSPI